MTSEIVNPSPEDIKTMSTCASFTIIGELTSVRKQYIRVPHIFPHYPPEEKSRYVVYIMSDEDVLYALRCDSDEVVYGDGILENVRDSTPTMGETVSVQAGVYELEGVSYLTIGYGKLTLVAPSDERQAEYDRLRARVDHMIHGVDMAACDGHYADARELYADTVVMALTKDERLRLRAIATAMPCSEMPVIGSVHSNLSQKVAETFGFRPEACNRDQFLEMAARALNGDLDVEGGKLDTHPSELFRYLHERPFDEYDQAKLFGDALMARLAKLETVGRSFDEYRDSENMVERCFTYLGSNPLPEAFMAIAAGIDFLLERRYFDDRLYIDEPYGCPDKFSSCMREAFEALQTRGYRDIELPEDFDYGRIQKWRNVLSAYPFMTRELDILQEYYSATRSI